jgi:hypothetical protein
MDSMVNFNLLPNIENETIQKKKHVSDDGLDEKKRLLMQLAKMSNGPKVTRACIMCYSNVNRTKIT